jgi:hypothetical protein
VRHDAARSGAGGLRRAIAGGTLAALLAAQAGCYTSRPVSAPGPAAGTHVVATLTATGSEELAGEVGPRVGAVEGVVQRSRGDTLELGVVRTIGRNGLATPWLGETVRLPRPVLAELHERTLDRRRSVAAAVLLTAGALLLARAVGGVVGAEGEGPREPTPPN